MTRKLLIATAALAPLMLHAGAASAETQVTSNSRTTPIATSTAAAGAADDVTITADGVITLSTAGAIATVDSNNTLTNNGSMVSVGVDDSIGVLVLGGHAGTVTNALAISLTETYTATDTDSDGDLDGPFAQGTNRYGIRLQGPGVFTGDIVQASTGSIIIAGNNSAGISLETGLVGNLSNLGSITVTGDNSYGVHVTGGVTGNVTQSGAVSVTGLNATGVALDSDVTGAVVIQGSITTTGYRYTTRPTETAIGLLEADDLLQGGPAVRVAGDVGGGVLLNGPTFSTVVDGTSTTATTISSSATGTASINTYGGAPALLIGSDTRAITIGAVGADDNAYGLLAKGGISASGIYDKIATTAVQIGGAAGQTTTLVGGARFDSTVSASSREANSTAVSLTAGAVVPSLWNRGSISSVSSSYAGSGLSGDARGLVIAAGATLGSLDNSGTIAATRSGETGDAVAVLDASGTLTSITNSGSIAALITAPTIETDGLTATTTAVATGTAVAFDLSANTRGVTLTQTAPVSTTTTTTYPAADTTADAITTTVGTATTTTIPSIVGAIRFGSGDDTLNLLAGTIIGNVSFGAGADALNIDGGGYLIGALTDSDGKLDIKIGDGSLAITNAETIHATSVNLGADATLIFTADPTAGTQTKLVVDTATIASGATLGLNLKSLLSAPTTYTVITAGSLTSGTIDQNLLGHAPYMYVANAYASGNDVDIDVRRRTAAEASMSRSEASAYDAIFAALGQNTSIAGAFLNQSSHDGFFNLYDQMLPSQGEGLFAGLQTVQQQISAATANRPDPGDRYGPDSVWVQEINALIRRDSGDTLGSDTQAIGVVAGYEAMGDAGGALGVTLAVVSLEEHDVDAKVGEKTTADMLQGGVYWRRSIGGWRLNLGGGVGYSRFNGDRSFISEDMNADGVADVVVKNTAAWNGLTANAFAGLAYEARVAGSYYLRPEGRLDYVWLWEGERKEHGGGDGFDLTVASRKADNLSGDIGLVLGTQYGKDVWVRPEIRIGYRQTLAGAMGDTIASFAGGTPFTLSPSTESDGAVTLGFALRTGSALSYFAVEGGAEASRKQTRYTAKLVGRAMF